ncbi:Aldo/keto reductase family-domain-containing protein [Stachybotrys elegans]|uniref:Aldo/keto reductase family-domain-containing protein n=1 Tax=Stachybotrys elegans TaxID=80388 RepID=A0A8K0SMR9_9HYPO|nr:Aldo/keto reductase family-domain-containing protein [Stachybotrys elegans]
MSSKTPLSRAIPPLVLGCAAFSKQFHPDPPKMPYVQVIRRALELNVAAFDTSPYYGPSEILLGDALKTLRPPREKCFLITKAGRIVADQFDYSPEWIRYSVYRSLDRLGTNYLDLVYTHDAEFVSPSEVLAAVTELRRLRDQGLIRYVGISGYPVETLASLAEMILRETGEPLDAVMSYGHLCIQNMRLANPELLQRFSDAGVDCIPNASILGMGLLTTRGVDAGPMAYWHPAPPPLRKTCKDLGAIAEAHGEDMTEVALRFALQTWARTGSAFGSHNAVPSERLGVCVLGVAVPEELEESARLWKSVVSGLTGANEDDAKKIDKITALVQDKMWPSLGSWKDYSWDSPDAGWINTRNPMGLIPVDEVATKWGLVQQSSSADRPRYRWRLLLCMGSVFGHGL